MKQVLLFVAMVAAVALPCVADDDYNWQGDPTLRWQPMFVTHIEQKMNVFNATWDGSNESLSQEHTYDRLVFKHRATPVTLVDGRFVLDECGSITGCFELDDAKQCATMFRGYGDDEMTPIVVPQAFLNDHTPLEFSRWKEGEPVVMLGASHHPERLAQIAKRYRGHTIESAQWLASCPKLDMDIYEVVFAQEPKEALAVMVVFRDGEIAHVWEDAAEIDRDNPNCDRTDEGKLMHVWMTYDCGEYCLPELQAIMIGPKGVELYARQSGVESYYHYIIFRESGDRMTPIRWQEVGECE
ncbi:MAG: hypothetical protein II519_03335 [Muribaculaceae bacterium]|nr:hypothetical protein [Muribaculaceae bacterium]